MRRCNASGKQNDATTASKGDKQGGWKEEEEKGCLHLFPEEELHCELGRELIVRLVGAHSSETIGMRWIRLLSERITLISITLIASKFTQYSAQIRVISSWNLEEIEGNQAEKRGMIHS